SVDGETARRHLGRRQGGIAVPAQLFSARATNTSRGGAATHQRTVALGRKLTPKRTSGRSVVQVNDAVCVDVRVVEPESGSGAGVEEKRLLATADHDRIDEEVQCVDESVGQQRADERAATTDVDIAGAPG